MRNILAKENSDLLAQFACSRVLLAFDFDGTLAPIVQRRGDARMRTKTASTFKTLCALYPCAVISGRRQKDVSNRLSKASVKYIVGNHGIEPGSSYEHYKRIIADARATLSEALTREPGLDIEDKAFSLAIHYRHSRRKQVARKTIRSAIDRLDVPMRIVPGKLVVNILPAGAPDKGHALLNLRSLEHADTAIYIGDDVTDEDVFTIDQPGRLLCIRVGASQSSAAPYYLRSQREIDGLLAKLVGLRKDRLG